MQMKMPPSYVCEDKEATYVTYFSILFLNIAAGPTYWDATL